jgi:hypothetical protein
MGAICFDRYDRYEGERWFEKAIERGASRESIDVEIKKSVARMKDKDKRDQMIRDLLKKDSHRYSWANKYLSKIEIDWAIALWDVSELKVRSL